MKKFSEQVCNFDIEVVGALIVIDGVRFTTNEIQRLVRTLQHAIHRIEDNCNNID